MLEFTIRISGSLLLVSGKYRKDMVLNMRRWLLGKLWIKNFK